MKNSTASEKTPFAKKIKGVAAATAEGDIATSVRKSLLS